VSSPDSFFQAQNAPKSVFGRGRPAGGAYDAPPDPLVGWGTGYPLPIPLPTRYLRRLELGASVLRPPQHKILAIRQWYFRGLPVLLRGRRGKGEERREREGEGRGGKGGEGERDLTHTPVANSWLRH